MHLPIPISLSKLASLMPVFLMLVLGIATSIGVSTAVRGDDLVGLPPNPDARPDFSGSWQKDYRRSDDWEQQVELKIAEIRRQVERQSRDRQGALSMASQARSNGTTIIDLARFSELISRHNDLFITQSDNEIRIKREGEADLICGTGNLPIKTPSNEYGSEVCGWNQHQLIFMIALPDGVGIYHRFVVSDDREAINLRTRVSSGNSLSFDLIQFFNRYEAPNGYYRCEQTLTRGKVCSQDPNFSAGDS